ncbi:DUF411 domain-containing protein [Microbulbifer halophilus]|uniref:DUF411 domain-containing protein n=1 Tax=Microbulbifer halophilus TaxID=453963 RepID=A0ABW5EEG7_9GAMM|nr:DUF411 domain-containing protein [Microbulbifer halophilus]MCW8128228.1 DUF411 domain-containing protein [Microbulbifer halophilus]
MHRPTDRLSCFLLAVVILGAAPLWVENARSDDEGENGTASSGELSGPLVVHKNPLCFCCKKWMAHLHRRGIETSTDNTTNMSRIKGQWAIPEGMHSCHTAVLNKKYVFEGHVPARFIRKYLSNPPEGSYGLTVPGMPEGSPGMYKGKDFEPYNIYLLMRGGDYRFYVRVEKPESR